MMKTIQTKQENGAGAKPHGRRIAAGAMAAVLAAMIALCVVLGATKGETRTVKVTYDGNTYTGKDGDYPSGGRDYDYGMDWTAGASKNELAGLAPDGAESFVAAEEPAGTDGSLDVFQDGGDAGTGRKITYSYDYDAETTDFDGMLSEIGRFLSDTGGYVESSSVNTRDFDRVDKSATDSVRRGTYYLKIPAGRCAEFRELLAGGEAQITYETKRMSDKTKAYADLGLQKQSYLAEYGALEALLAQATDVSDLIEIQDRLSYLNYQIQSMDKQMQLIDEDVELSDVELTLSEVVYYTATIQEYRFRFGERMADAFEDFVYAVPDFLFAMAFLAAGGFVVIGLCSVLFRVMFDIRNKKSRGQVIRVVHDGGGKNGDVQV